MQSPGMPRMTSIGFSLSVSSLPSGHRADVFLPLAQEHGPHVYEWRRNTATNHAYTDQMPRDISVLMPGVTTRRTQQLRKGHKSRDKWVIMNLSLIYRLGLVLGAVANMTHWHLGTRGLLEIKSPLVQVNVSMWIFIIRWKRSTLGKGAQRKCRVSVCQQSCRKRLLDARAITAVARYRDWIHHWSLNHDRPPTPSYLHITYTVALYAAIRAEKPSGMVITRNTRDRNLAEIN